jgi:hypothetical protein
MIKQNSLVQLTQSYCDWIESMPNVSPTIKSYVTERRFFYLGLVPNMSNICLLASLNGYIINCIGYNDIEEVILTPID